MSSEWVPAYVAAAELQGDGRISGESAVDVIEAGFSAGAAWTRTTASGREVDLGSFAAVTVTSRGPARPARDAANGQACEAYREKQFVDDLAAVTQDAGQRAVFEARSSYLQGVVQRIHGKFV